MNCPARTPTPLSGERQGARRRPGATVSASRPVAAKAGGSGRRAGPYVPSLRHARTRRGARDAGRVHRGTAGPAQSVGVIRDQYGSPGRLHFRHPREYHATISCKHPCSRSCASRSFLVPFTASRAAATVAPSFGIVPFDARDEKSLDSFLVCVNWLLPRIEQV